MLDYIAYLQARQRTADSALDARPDSPVQPPDEPRRLVRMNARIRRMAGRTLRDLADRLEPATERAHLVSEECR